MADTEFSGDLMGLKSGIFNPHHSYKTSFVTNDVFPAPSDRGLVDYLVHGKDTMIQTYDATIGDLPYVEKKVWEGKSDKARYWQNKPLHYDLKKWCDMMTAHPACCTILYNPEYEIIHTAPYHIKPVESPYPLDDEHKFVFTPVVSTSTPTPRGIEYPDSMIDAVPYTVKMVTSKVITEIEEFRGEAYVSLKAQSPFFGLKGMKLIDAKLNYIGGFKDKEDEDEEEDDYDPLYGVDYIDEGEGDEDYFVEEDDKEKSEEELKDEKELEDEMYNLEHRPSQMSNSQLIYHYKANYTDKCRPCGRMSDEDYQTFDFKGVVLDHIPGKIRFDDDDEFESVLATIKPVMRIGKVVHYRAGHWLDGDIVETQKPQVRMTHPTIYVDKETFYRRTRIEGHRGGIITVPQWKWLFGFDKVPEAVKTAPSGIHPLAPLLRMKRVSGRFVDGLRLAGYTVEKRRVGDSHRDVQCLIVP